MPDNDKKPVRKEGFITPNAVEVLVGGASLAAGGVTARSLVKGMAYKNMSSLGAVADMKPERMRSLQAIEDQIDRGAINSKEAFQQLDRLVEVNDRAAWTHFRKFGVQNFADEWKILRTHQKVEALAFAAVTAGVALGALLPLMREWSKDKDEPKR